LGETSFVHHGEVGRPHHQPEAQHPKSSAIHKPPADYPIYASNRYRNGEALKPS
jgi:hypothetical protein